MIGTRLPLAFEAGLILPDDGPIAVWHPAGDADLSTLHDPHVIQPFRPAHDLWCARGRPTSPEPEGPYSVSIVCLPRAKAEARALIAAAMEKTSDIVVLDGQKTDGADSMLKAIRARHETSAPISKAHGKLFWMEPTDAFADWSAGPALTPGGFWTAPGVFSADGIDPASALLVDALPSKLKGRIADLGAGWGYLSAHVLTRDAVTEVHLVEANHMALQCAEHNVTDQRARFHWADATQWTIFEPLDAIVMNPPFHTERAGDPGLGQTFIAAAASLLKPSGQLWMVANRHLPYEATLASHFAKTVELGGDARFKLLQAERPKRRS